MSLLNFAYLNDDLLRHPIWVMLLAVLIFYCCCLAGLGFYRLYLSPISKIPGPTFAALTYWYEFYYDCVKQGKYTFEIEKMHDKYGPIIRINPGEVHVMDPDFYEVLYTGSNKRRDKPGWSYHAFGCDDSTFSTLNHEHHRVRRSVLNPSFSKRAVLGLEDTIHGCVETMCMRFRDWKQFRKPLRVRDAYAALSLDVISEYCFATSFDSLNHPDLDASALRSADRLVKNGPMLRQFKWLFPLTKSMPEWLALRLFPDMANTLHLHSILRERALKIINGDPNELAQGDATVMHKILQSGLPPEDKALQRLVEEGQVFIVAGQTTTADTLERATYELLSNPEKLEKLLVELKAAIPNPHELPSWRKLEQLPYLRAVITESLRLATPVPSRLQRIATDEDLKVQGTTIIPAGTPIGMSAYLMHFRNPHFPEAKKFQPERWLVPEKERHRLEKYLVPFSKGTRTCLGMHLAEAELYIALAAIFRRFGMELYETTLEDIQFARDYFTGLPYEGSERLRVLVKAEI